MSPIRSFTSKLIATLVLLIVVLGVFQVALTIMTTRLHLMRVDQSLNRDLATSILNDAWLSKEGDLPANDLGKNFDRLMAINPITEIYLLDPEGRILRYSAPPERVRLPRVDLAPVDKFISGTPDLPIVGDDPRDPDQPKAFSAAPIWADGQLSGYLYVVLGGEAYRSVASMFEGSQVLRLSLGLIVGGLLLALAIGVFTSHRLGRRLRTLAGSMSQFASSDFRRMPEPVTTASTANGDEIDELSKTFSCMARKIGNQLASLEAIDESRRELIVHISHDLKTPLATLQGYLETLNVKWDKLNVAERRSYLDSSLNFSQRLGQMIADLLELARLDTAEAPLRLETWSMDELVQDVCLKFRFDADHKAIELSPEIIAPGRYVEADIGLIERVLANLIDNAIKFTPRDGRICVSMSEVGNKILTHVVDTGIGIPEGELTNIFDRFYRVERQLKGVSGIGLGLAIAKRVVELHGGRIGVESTVDMGTTMTFSLPSAPKNG